MMDIDKMEAGWELDALVAERVMGLGPIIWKRYVDDNGGFDGELFDDIVDSDPVACKSSDEGACPWSEKTRTWLHRYSAYIDAAWQVWLKMPMLPDSSGWSIWRANNGETIIGASFPWGMNVIAQGDAPLAICRASLKAAKP